MLKDLLFPKVCVGCGFIGSYICIKCEGKLSYINDDHCLYCGKLSLYGLTHPICRRKLGIDGAISIFHYNDFLKKIVKIFKYRLAIDLWLEFRNVIKPEKLLKLNIFRKENYKYLLQPIPLYLDREKTRGFNQSLVIAEFFEKFLQIPIINLLFRSKNTVAQAQIANGKKRYSNIKDAFRYVNNNNVKNKAIILIDDVLTTGLTIREAAKKLKKNGFDRVYGLTLAKG